MVFVNIRSVRERSKKKYRMYSSASLEFIDRIRMCSSASLVFVDIGNIRVRSEKNSIAKHELFK